MLILKRNDGESLTITHASGDSLQIKVHREKGGVVLAFFDPHNHFNIWRDELKDRGRRPTRRGEVTDHWTGGEA